MAPLRRSNPLQQSLRRIHKSFRDGANTAANAIRLEAEANIRRIRHVPRRMRVLRKIYHEYGLKHILLITVLIIYQFIGAAIFYLCEATHDESREMFWKENVKQNRSRLIDIIVTSMFNNSEYLFFVTANQTIQVRKQLNQQLSMYEKNLGIKYTDQKIRWDFWNAMLYAQTICTTIGYGHLYPSTTTGRIFTMLYAIVGIPLVLSILDDLDLEIFDLPIPIAISVVIAWIFICSATFCLWEKDWDYFVAFYFFFISLSTIGLGDITPTQPKYLLMLFIYIIIGLSLVSMCINLIQSEMARTYEVGQLDNLSITSTDLPFGNLDHKVSDKTHIGSGSRNDSIRSLACRATRDALISRKKFNKSSQTMLSFPSPYANLSTDKYAYNGGIKLLPRNLSIDDVMKLVDTEEGDILVLTELLGDDSSNSDNGNDDTGGQTDHSKLLTGNYPRTSSLAAASPSTSLIKNAFSNRTNRNGNETNEEIENRILLGRSTTNTFNLPAVHFKPRLSMISENHGVINEGNGEPYIDENEENDDDDDDDDDTRPLEIKSIKESEPTLEQTRNSVGNTRNMVSLIGSLLSGRGTKKNQRKESMNAKSVHELANE